jgi:predicted dehydrogenase
MNKINIALIGYGYWGKVLHKYLDTSSRFNLKHVCDSKTSLDTVWPDVEAVVIATPIETHYPLVKEALLQGKHVLSEKPLTLSIKEGLELKKLAEDQGLVLVTEYTQTFSKSLKEATKIDIGQLQAIDMVVRHLGRFMEHDVYWLLASHCLSILDMFTPLKSLKFQRNDYLKTEDRTETGVITFKGQDIKGQISLSLNYPGKDYQVVIYGSKGTIIYDTQQKHVLRVVWYKKIYKKLPNELTQEEKTFDIDESNNVKLAIDYFHNVITGKEKTNLDRALEITKILEELNQSTS